MRIVYSFQFPKSQKNKNKNKKTKAIDYLLHSCKPFTRENLQDLLLLFLELSFGIPYHFLHLMCNYMGRSLNFFIICSQMPKKSPQNRYNIIIKTTQPYNIIIKTTQTTLPTNMGRQRHWGIVHLVTSNVNHSTLLTSRVLFPTSYSTMTFSTYMQSIPAINPMIFQT